MELFKRTKKYTPDKFDIEHGLTFESSKVNNKVYSVFHNTFVRFCDYPYDELNGNKIKRHMLIIPIDKNNRDHKEEREIRQEFLNKGRFARENSSLKKSITGVPHIHLFYFDNINTQKITGKKTIKGDKL